MSNAIPNRPEITFVARNKGVFIEAAVWNNEYARGGRTFTSRSATIAKQYRDPDTNEWHTTSTFYPDELPMVCLVADRAYAYIVLKSKDDNETSVSAESSA